jgi:hypothetical protein
MCSLVHSLCASPAISTARLKSFGWSSRTQLAPQVPCPKLVRYVVRNDRDAHVTVLRCEWTVRDHVQSMEKRLQRRRFSTGDPRFNGLRRNA